ncbi:hypothetical protein J7L48_02370 [bacterium]|nr:hypothetical protein [bacterium]
MSAIGLNLGTAICKAISINEWRKIIASANIEYQTIKSKQRCIELNLLDFWACIKK